MPKKLLLILGADADSTALFPIVSSPMLIYSNIEKSLWMQDF